ncbi:transcriptional regulator [Georgenia sp. TF02-10]|uniref:transcriptional regulator n=1 Tax=Georgenia sp. TF02-10 TaxID=2917725 RepID=UPI001FA776F8|nr:transcriptional regulator [Georgenia sp. TF02-10]UNX53960.1 transcriptional regulator [Georgenia sp. TF02-10]
MKPRFDEIVHAPNRLKICSLLTTAGSAEFSTIRDVLGVADSVTSKQLKVLADAGYIRLTKRTGAGGRAKTWATLTGEGRSAFEGHLAMLQQLAAEAARAPG